VPDGIKVYEKVLPNNPLFHNEIVQHITITKDGSIEIPWITPKATLLILSLWGKLYNEKDFPITMIEGKNLYCG
jgi:hypothetical protein